MRDVRTPRAELEERKRQALRDVRHLEAQVRAGEIDEPTGTRLRAVYEAEAANVIAALQAPGTAEEMAAADGAGGRVETGGDRGRGGRRDGSGPSRRRVLAGVALVAAGIIAVAAVLGDQIMPRPPGGFITGVEVGGPPLDDPDVAIERLERAVEAFPDLVPMRLQLGHRYLADQQLDAALEQYLAVLEREPHPEALSRAGWILFLSGEPELAARMIEESLTREPGDPVASWFLANVLLYGLGDAAGAVPLLENLATRDDLPDRARADVAAALDDARNAEGSP